MKLKKTLISLGIGTALGVGTSLVYNYTGNEDATTSSIKTTPHVRVSSNTERVEFGRIPARTLVDINDVPFTDPTHHHTEFDELEESIAVVNTVATNAQEIAVGAQDSAQALFDVWVKAKAKYNEAKLNAIQGYNKIDTYYRDDGKLMVKATIRDRNTMETHLDARFPIELGGLVDTNESGFNVNTNLSVLGTVFVNDGNRGAAQYPQGVIIVDSRIPYNVGVIEYPIDDLIESTGNEVFAIKSNLHYKRAEANTSAPTNQYGNVEIALNPSTATKITITSTEYPFEIKLNPVYTTKVQDYLTILIVGASVPTLIYPENVMSIGDLPSIEANSTNLVSFTTVASDITVVGISKLK